MWNSVILEMTGCYLNLFPCQICVQKMSVMTRKRHPRCFDLCLIHNLLTLHPLIVLLNTATCITPVNLATKITLESLLGRMESRTSYLLDVTARTAPYEITRSRMLRAVR